MTTISLSKKSLSIASAMVAAILLMLGALIAVSTALWDPNPISSQLASDQPARQSSGFPASFLFRDDVAPDEAAVINAAIPDTSEPIVPARPFALSPQVTNATRLTAIDCLTAAIYYEAASEGLSGQRAVAQVVLNRMRHSAYPNSICAVVFQGAERRTGCQFTFTCDGALRRRPSVHGWATARSVALSALSGYVEPSVGFATHYHTRWVVPYWSGSLTKLRTVGEHIFYRWTGGAGTGAAFHRPYANFETIPSSAASRLAGFLMVQGAVPSAEAPNLSSSDEASRAYSTSSLMPHAERRMTAGLGVESKANLAPTDHRLKSDEAPRLLEQDAKLIER